MVAALVDAAMVTSLVLLALPRAALSRANIFKEVNGGGERGNNNAGKAHERVSLVHRP